MMSAPDRVDVELPNTEEVKMTSVSSTGNLRNLVPPDQQQGHQHSGKFFFRILCAQVCTYVFCIADIRVCLFFRCKEGYIYYMVGLVFELACLYSEALDRMY